MANIVFTDKTKFANRRIVVFVPSTRFAKKIPKTEFSRRVIQTAKFLTKTFGGTTRFKASGTYETTKQGKKIVISEPIVEVEAFVPESMMTIDNRLALKDFLHGKAKEWEQESLAVKMENPQTKGEQLHFFSGETNE
jgi:hypothetical protein